MKRPEAARLDCALAAGPSRSLYVQVGARAEAKRALFRYDDGKLVGPVRLAGGGTVVGFWAGSDVTLNNDRLLIGAGMQDAIPAPTPRPEARPGPGPCVA